MKFNLNTDDPRMKALLEFSNGDKVLLEQALHNAYQEDIIQHEFVEVKIKTIKNHIELLKGLQK